MQMVGIEFLVPGSMATVFSIYTSKIHYSVRRWNNGSVYIYGAQVEELSYATSYIPTYGAVRTRLQDSVTGAGTSSDFNSVEGVLFAEVVLSFGCRQ